jgi:hypothetical protein
MMQTVGSLGCVDAKAVVARAWWRRRRWLHASVCSMCMSSGLKSAVRWRASHMTTYAVGAIVVVGMRGCDEGAEPRGVPAGPSLEPVGGQERSTAEGDGLRWCEGDGRNVVGWAGLDGEVCAVSADAGLVDVDVAGVAGEEGGGDESGAGLLACEETDAVGAGEA